MESREDFNITTKHNNFLWLLITLIIALAVGVTVFVLRQQEVASLKEQLVAAVNTEPTNDSRVIAASKAFCEARVPTSGNMIIFQAGTVDGKGVLYSADQKFAYINVGCDEAAITETNFAGSGRAYYLKNVNGIWLVLAESAQDLDPATKAKFGFPNLFN